MVLSLRSNNNLMGSQHYIWGLAQSKLSKTLAKKMNTPVPTQF